MTQRLDEAFRAAPRLPPADQDALAESILAELADEAHAEYTAGRTEVLDPDRL